MVIEGNGNRLNQHERELAENSTLIKVVREELAKTEDEVRSIHREIRTLVANENICRREVDEKIELQIKLANDRLEEHRDEHAKMLESANSKWGDRTFVMVTSLCGWAVAIGLTVFAWLKP